MNIDTRDCMRGTQLTIVVSLRSTWRIRLGLRLIRLGAWVCGMTYIERPLAGSLAFPEGCDYEKLVALRKPEEPR